MDSFFIWFSSKLFSWVYLKNSQPSRLSNCPGQPSPQLSLTGDWPSPGQILGTPLTGRYFSFVVRFGSRIATMLTFDTRIDLSMLLSMYVRNHWQMYLFVFWLDDGFLSLSPLSLALSLSLSLSLWCFNATAVLNSTKVDRKNVSETRHR